MVCEKPINMPVQADSSGDTDLLTVAKAYIKEKYNKPGEVYLGLVHRLDRPVGGVIVFARTSKAAARLTESFKTGKTKKRYAAIVSGKPENFEKLENFLVKNEKTHNSSVVPKETLGAKSAALEYSKVTDKQGLTLLDVLLLTGRHHQIRVQLSNAGYPIYGDQRYNTEAKTGQQIALYAYSLTVEHPTLKTRMTFSSIPEGKQWSIFSEELNALANGVSCIYIDKNIICVNKTAGIATAEKDCADGESSLETELKCAFGEKNVYPVHRLDVMTTGLVLFTRNKEAQKILQDEIRNRKLRRFYWTEVFGHPDEKSGELSFFAVKDNEKAFVRVYDKKIAGAVKMETRYKCLRTHGNKTLLEMELITGKTHQIRASLAHIGCPVIGDDKYGDRQLNKGKKGIRLASVRIEFPKEMPELKYLSGKVFEAQAAFLNTREQI